MLQSSGLVQGYSVFGHMAQMRYTEPVATLDAHVLIAVSQPDLQLLERQASWQRTRQALTWPEKGRMAEQVRESILQLRRSGQGEAASGIPARTESHFGRPK